MEPLKKRRRVMYVKHEEKQTPVFDGGFHKFGIPDDITKHII